MGPSLPDRNPSAPDADLVRKRSSYRTTEVSLPPAPGVSAVHAGMREVTERLAALREWDEFDMNRTDPSLVRPTYKNTEVIEHTGGVYAVAPLADGRRFYLSGYNGLALAYQMSTSERTWGRTWWEHQPIATVPGKGYTMQRLPNGSLVTGGGDGAIHIHLPHAAQCDTETVATSNDPLFAVQALPTNAIVSGGADGTIRIHTQEAPGMWLVENLPRTASVLCLQALPDGRIVAGTSDGSLLLWKRTGSGSWGREETRAHSGPINCLQMLADGTIVTGGADGIIRIWRNNGYATYHSHDLKGHTGAIRSLHALSDCTILSGSADTTLRVWREVATPSWQRLIGGTPSRWTSRTLKGHQGEVLCGLFMADGSIVSGSTDGTARVWRGR